ncbi:MAG: fused MFS/spermidine synthase [Verrucomicrobia bacterium]|nr:fused MFS/spermidine synthase [Verrucomicrobiota bacterium]
MKPNNLFAGSLFAVTLFVSAALLFSVQPMIARMLLPLLGGAPAVWNTCMVFFQAMLLAGYAYAHYTSAWLGFRKQALLHIVLLAVAAIFLPIKISTGAAPTTESNAVFWLLGTLLLTAGLPFFIVSTTSALLQKWFSWSAHPAAKDPYFLYVASNLGSLMALLAYPVAIEPNLRLPVQSHLWSISYVLMAGLILGCALWIWRANASLDRAGSAPEAPALLSPPAWRQRLRWVGLAFVPSSLMLGVTSYLANDIAAIPLLWIVPLAIYLLTFVFAFERRELIRPRWLEPAVAVSALSVTLLLVSEATEPVWMILLLHLLFFFCGGLACHRRLALDRPPAENLTVFYLCLSMGGVLGGVFNALVAPVLFKTVAEYPIALALTCGLYRSVKSVGSSKRQRVLDLAFPLATVALSALLAALVSRFTQLPYQARSAVVFGVPLILVYACVERPWRFALALGALLASSYFAPGEHGRTLHVARSFFGVSRVTLDLSGRFHRLVHGNTLHGLQFIDPARRHEPLAYYHRNGPLGQVFQVYNARPASPRVAVVGLGSGATAAYAQTNQAWTFYEIDPVVVRIARDTNYFSFLADCAAEKMNIELGDARLRLQHAAAAQFGLIVLDAFSSDAIPVHLLTREALQLYLSKLAPGGLIAIHISNRCLDLEPVLRALADDARLASAEYDEDVVPAAAEAEGKFASQWVVLARKRDDFGLLNRNARWVQLTRRADLPVWTDDFSNLLSIFRWK